MRHTFARFALVPRAGLGLLCSCPCAVDTKKKKSKPTGGTEVPSALSRCYHTMQGYMEALRLPSAPSASAARGVSLAMLACVWGCSRAVLSHDDRIRDRFSCALGLPCVGLGGLPGGALGFGCGWVGVFGGFVSVALFLLFVLSLARRVLFCGWGGGLGLSLLAPFAGPLR